MKLVVIYNDGSAMELEIRKYEDKYNNDFFYYETKDSKPNRGIFISKKNVKQIEVITNERCN